MEGGKSCGYISMACLVKTMRDPPRESIAQVDGDVNTWLIGPLQLHCRKGVTEIVVFVVPGKRTRRAFSAVELEGPNKPCVYIPINPVPLDDPRFKLVYDAGDSSAVWSVGNSAFCKVKLCRQGITSEAATLEFVQKLVYEQQSRVGQASPSVRPWTLVRNR
jgi:hypothetical protein